MALRTTLLVSFGDLPAVVREFPNPNVSRSGRDRCLRRHGLGNLRDLQVKAARPKHSGVKAYEPGYMHIHANYLPPMADETWWRYLSWPSTAQNDRLSSATSRGRLRRMLGAS